MEDENGLELSLGLSCGGSSAKFKGKSGAPSNTKAEEGDRSTKLVDDFKDFLHGGAQKQDSSSSSQRSDSVKPKENFFNDLSKANVDADASINLNGRGVWVANNNKSDELEEEKRSEAGNKRKSLFDEMNHQKKHERETHYTDVHDKTRTSHISITEDGSTAENEDVADSEVEGSSSVLISQHDEGSKRFVGSGDSSEAQKEVRRFAESSVVDLNGQKRFNISAENKLGNMAYGSPFSVQSVNMMNMPYSLPMKESSSVGATSTSGHPMHGMMQVMPTVTSERSGTQPVNPGNLPVLFGYSPVQLPMLDKDNSWGLVPHTQQFHPSYAGRNPPNSAGMQVISHNSSDVAQYDGRMLERGRGDGKQNVTEEGSSSQAEEDMKVNSTNLRIKDAPDPSTAEDFSLDFSAIKPGIAADIKFGGSGSRPNLPWVSTKGPGPNGRTISGVTYRYGANQIRIVCACHSLHMSPEEFVRHASEEPSNPESGTGMATFPNGNPAASAQS
ncbi:PREDICTED: ninja-family [Prunus dulcis]|uniref:Ninja-family protein n=1 Tax=Prunus dulcis TaxID=3755 RepID=A0A5E4E713_PRUDU|nr:ninja-family protein mc410 [Prunus dulcis]XP_034224379.1 ninja-family protein mc410 [Prunus dulcis]KAI5320391.1 hypothetical protein L3X38_040099 [Prunus dulcis]VVA10521.1 PREDICTED: ninja-family [Prunus dulcis]